MISLTRRRVIAGSASLAGARVVDAHAAAPSFRVGYQKYGNLALLKGSGQLEDKLGSLGVPVEWKQYLSGPLLLEALAADEIDVGSAGEAPPIFAQAAGAPIIYLASEPPAPKGEAILVAGDSQIRTVADLRGKTIALNRSSNVHYLVIRALEAAGLTPRDVSLKFLGPVDGRAAFENGHVDAWAIWDPYLAAAQTSGRTRTLIDGSGLVANHQFYLGTRRVADPGLLQAFREAIVRIDRRTSFDPTRTAEILSQEVGLPAAVMVKAVGRQAWNVRSMDPKLVADQQAVADTFYKTGLIQKPIRIADALA